MNWKKGVLPFLFHNYLPKCNGGFTVLIVDDGYPHDRTERDINK